MDEKIPPNETVTQEADRLVSGDRGSSYGHPLDDFCKTAVLWGVILKKRITAEEVAKCMSQVKVSRELNKHKRDNLVDECGYVKCLDMVIEERARRVKEGWSYDEVTGVWSPPTTKQWLDKIALEEVEKP
jgi:hypothetical protein